MVNHSTHFENADVEMDIKENWVQSFIKKVVETEHNFQKFYDFYRIFPVFFATKHIKNGEQIFIRR